MTHENNPVLGYGIIDTHDPLYLGKGGYGFLIRQKDRESVEELREWFTRVVQKYPLVNDDLTFAAFYRAGAPESAIKYELGTSLYHRNTLLLSSEHFGYHTSSWDTIRHHMKSDKAAEKKHRSIYGTVDDYEPFS